MEQTSDQSKRVAVVISSTRPIRICPGIANWVLQVAQEGSPLRYERVDLAEINLPFLDEPLKAALHQYEHEHTKHWSRLVSSFNGFIIVSPQYNWGYPGVLKNALDFLFDEWRGKPVTCVTYGTRGGGKAAEQLSGVFAGLHMLQLEDHVEVIISEADVDENWQLRDVDALMNPYRAQTRAVDEAMVEALEDTQ